MPLCARADSKACATPTCAARSPGVSARAWLPAAVHAPSLEGLRYTNLHSIFFLGSMRVLGYLLLFLSHCPPFERAYYQDKAYRWRALTDTVTLLCPSTSEVQAVNISWTNDRSHQYLYLI